MYVETKRVDEVFPLLPRLSADTPARYDLRLNLNLMKGGDQLKDQERFVEASLLYALTMTAEEVKNLHPSIKCINCRERTTGSLSKQSESPRKASANLAR